MKCPCCGEELKVQLRLVSEEDGYVSDGVTLAPPDRTKVILGEMEVGGVKKTSKSPERLEKKAKNAARVAKWRARKKAEMKTKTK